MESDKGRNRRRHHILSISLEGKREREREREREGRREKSSQSLSKLMEPSLRQCAHEGDISLTVSKGIAAFKRQCLYCPTESDPQ